MTKFADLLYVTAVSLSTSALAVGTVVTLGAAVSGGRTLAQVIADGASDPSKIKVGDTGIPFALDDGHGGRVVATFTITDATHITCTAINAVAGGGMTPAAFYAGAPVLVGSEVPDVYLNGVSPNQLPSATPADSQVVTVTDTSGNSFSMTLAAFKAYTGGTPADTTAPTVPTGLSTSSVTQNAATLNWAASTDNSGVAPTYETSRDGTAWTATSALSYGFTGLAASTLYTLQVRSVDGVGNRSAAASIQVTTAAASGDTTAPTMSGSITTSNITQTGLTMAYSAGADNVGVAHYEVSVDTGTANWVNNGLNLSYNATGLTAGTAYTERVRAVDAATNVSNVLTATATTSAAGTSYTVTSYTGTSLRTTIDASATASDSGKKYIDANAQSNGNPWWQFSTNPPAGAKSGWGTSATVAPAEITTSQNAIPTEANGMAPMNPLSAPYYESKAYLWVPVGSGTSTWYFWIKPSDGPAQCMTPAGVTVTGA